MLGDWDLARALIVAGIFLALLGVLIGISGRILNLGRLPGDIRIQKGNFTFYFPVVTCLLISLLLTALAWLFRGR